ncbi:PhoH family protein [Endozoicomonas sp. ALC066]|uniref:PhoH family protein n=1 Tax=Endozoicomonas sp. ALC066 TaxID=3403078 RepID=UPI003BB80C7F
MLEQVIDLKTERHEAYWTALQKPKGVIFALGCAGTGKTYMASVRAAEWLSSGKKNNVAIIRPNVSCGPSLGYRPGTMEDKMAEWIAPIRSHLNNLLGKSHVSNLLSNERISVHPIETVRGCTFDNTLIILDEAQNCTYEQLKALLTRIGKWSLMIVNGDTGQTDLKQFSGLSKVVNMAEFYTDADIITFTQEDIMRSDECAKWIRAFEMEESAA